MEASAQAAQENYEKEKSEAESAHSVMSKELADAELALKDLQAKAAVATAAAAKSAKDAADMRKRETDGDSKEVIAENAAKDGMKGTTTANALTPNSEL